MGLAWPISNVYRLVVVNVYPAPLERNRGFSTDIRSQRLSPNT